MIILSVKTDNQKSKKLWSVVAVLALGIIFIAAAAYSADEDRTVSQLGSHGGDVFLIQQRLRELGFYDGEENGVFDLETQRALLEFQRENGLDANGTADEQTRLKLGIGRSPLSEYSDAELLARFIEWRAGDGTYIDKVTAGAVVLNRMASPDYPDTVAGVVFQSGECDGFSAAVYNSEPSVSSEKAAADCLKGTDPTGGSTEF